MAAMAALAFGERNIFRLVGQMVVMAVMAVMSFVLPWIMLIPWRIFVFARLTGPSSGKKEWGETARANKVMTACFRYLLERSSMMREPVN